MTTAPTSRWLPLLAGPAASALARAGNTDNEGVTLASALERVGFGTAQFRVILVCGLCFMSDSIEIGMLSFLQSKAADEFGLDSAREALLTSVVFVGELAGALVFGPAADRFGRWRVSVASAAFVGVFGLASAFTWSFPTLALARALVGVGIGGLSVPFDTLAELVGPAERGRSLMSVEFFWSFGTMFTAGIAYAVLEPWGWRWFVALCSVPVLLALAAFGFMPESPHWLLSQGRHRDALRVLQRMARLNGRNALPDNATLVLGGDVLVASVPNPLWAMPARQVPSPTAPNGEEGEGGGGATVTAPAAVAAAPATDAGGTEAAYTVARQRALEAAETAWQVQKAMSVQGGGNGGKMLGRSGVLSVAVVSHSPYELFRPGLRSVTARLFVVWFAFAFAYYGVLLILPEVLSGSEDGIDYVALLISSSAEVVACCVGMALIDRAGRSLTAGVGYVLCGLFMAVMTLDNLSAAAVIALSMLARGGVFVGSSTTWVATPEQFPTAVRGTGHGWCNGVARIGGAITPFWGRAKLPQATRLALYSVVAALCGEVSLTLQETRCSALH